jgi:hypothetical protein
MVAMTSGLIKGHTGSQKVPAISSEIVVPLEKSKRSEFSGAAALPAPRRVE